jgi:hypothetical protein
MKVTIELSATEVHELEHTYGRAPTEPVESLVRRALLSSHPRSTPIVVLALGCEVRLDDAPEFLGDGAMLRLLMPPPDGRYAEVYLAVDDQRQLHGALGRRLPDADPLPPFRMARWWTPGSSSYRVETTQPLSEGEALVLLRKLGSPYRGQRYPNRPERTS